MDHMFFNLCHSFVSLILGPFKHDSKMAKEFGGAWGIEQPHEMKTGHQSDQGEKRANDEWVHLSGV